MGCVISFVMMLFFLKRIMKLSVIIMFGIMKGIVKMVFISFFLGKL